MSRPDSADGGPAAADGHVPAIEVDALHKTYGRRVALHHISLRVEPGEIFGFLGPNGAGKTTTVKILVGLVRQTSGRAQVFGRPPTDPAARRRLGYLPEHFRFQEWATGNELLDFHGRLAGMSAEERRERVPQVLEQVGLTGRGDEPVRRYSKGMTQRIGLAQAVMARPDLVMLDEPTSALDPVGRREVRMLVRALADDGVTVFLNSHLLTEVEAVCDRVAIIDRGRLVGVGRLGDLATAAPQLRLMLDRVDRELIGKLAQYGEVAEVQGTSVTLTVDDLDVAPAVAESLIGSGYRLYGLVPAQPSLEDVFVELVEGGDG